MSTITVAGKDIKVDGWGNLANPSDWDEEVAKALAKTDGIELSKAHWEVIAFIREYNKEFQITPAERVLIKAMGKRLGLNFFSDTRKYLYKLFPDGPSKQACRYAGMPTPMYTV